MEDHKRHEIEFYDTVEEACDNHQKLLFKSFIDRVNTKRDVNKGNLAVAHEALEGCKKAAKKRLDTLERTLTGGVDRIQREFNRITKKLQLIKDAMIAELTKNGAQERAFLVDTLYTIQHYDMLVSTISDFKVDDYDGAKICIKNLALFERLFDSFEILKKQCQGDGLKVQLSSELDLLSKVVAMKLHQPPTINVERMSTFDLNFNKIQMDQRETTALSRVFSGQSSEGGFQTSSSSPGQSNNQSGSDLLRRTLFASQNSVLISNLSLSDCKLTDDNLKPLLEVWGRNQNISSLDLSNNNLTLAVWSYFPPFSQKNFALESLDLSYNDFSGSECLHWMEQILIDCPFLKNVNLSYTGLQKKAASHLGTVLENSPSIKRFVLSGNNIGDDFAVDLLKGFNKNKTLQHLDLEENKISIAGASSLADALETNTSLLKLNLQNNRIGPDSLANLGSGLARNTSLREVNLCDCNLDLAGILKFFAKCTKNVSLETVDLSMNSLVCVPSEISASFMSDFNVLETSLPFRHLDLSFTKLTHQGFKQLAPVLEVAANLQNLDLSSNSLGVEGLEYLSYLLGNNHQLLRLNLSSNMMTLKGLLIIAKTLCHNQTLREIILIQNDINDQENFGEFKVACDLLSINQSLELLDFSGNIISQEGRKCLNLLKNTNRMLFLDKQDSVGGRAQYQRKASFKEHFNSGFHTFGASLHDSFEF
eukprot:CAMPEP_0114976776 /NCGR_PEP_ID=MMETSP0216-20121206/2864_1 /TAXON_ID=223996 /ORGANISM="Protocruzia adherens, Strain Boccale" /LENGTH=706 /DNA_ID=CAMNT_0002337749 /DNA_START=179 /DNA_END=2299 /DNA_ORIENTATION=-